MFKTALQFIAVNLLICFYALDTCSASKNGEKHQSKRVLQKEQSSLCSLLLLRCAQSQCWRRCLHFEHLNTLLRLKQIYSSLNRVCRFSHSLHTYFTDDSSIILRLPFCFTYQRLLSHCKSILDSLTCGFIDNTV